MLQWLQQKVANFALWLVFHTPRLLRCSPVKIVKASSVFVCGEAQTMEQSMLLLLLLLLFLGGLLCQKISVPINTTVHP